jgi:hypothetical protein
VQPVSAIAVGAWCGEVGGPIEEVTVGDGSDGLTKLQVIVDERLFRSRLLLELFEASSSGFPPRHTLGVGGWRGARVFAKLRLPLIGLEKVAAV